MKVWEINTANKIMEDIIAIETRMTALNLNGLINSNEYASLKKELNYLNRRFDMYCEQH